MTKKLIYITCKGYTLIYSLVFMLIISILVSSLIIISFFHRSNVDNVISYEELFTQSRQFLKIRTIYGDNYFEGFKTSFYKDNQFQIDYEFFESDWGVLKIKGIKATNRIDSVTINTFVIKQGEQDQKSSIYVANIDRELQITGNTSIKGDVFVPSRGIKVAYVEGKRFAGNDLFLGNKYTSTTEVPKLNEYEELIKFENIKNRMITFASMNSQNVYDNIYNDTIINSFKNSTILIYSKNEIDLDNVIIKGNVAIVSENRIIANDACILEDVILIAPEILFKRNFNGKIQAFASNTIQTEEMCSFKFPSALIVSSSMSKEGSKEIYIGEGSIIEGLVMLQNNSGFSSKQSIIVINNAKVMGQVYSSDLLELKGEVYGTVYTKKFSLKTSSAYYENLLIDAKIENTKANEYLGLIPVIDNKQKKENIAKWLY